MNRRISSEGHSKSGRVGLRSKSGTIRQRGECPGAGQKRDSQEQAVKRSDQKQFTKRVDEDHVEKRIVASRRVVKQQEQDSKHRGFRESELSCLSHMRLRHPTRID